MNAIDQKEKDRRLRERYAELGIVKTSVWVPIHKKKELFKITKRWREIAKKGKGPH